MKRRSVLAALAAGTALAGCFGNANDDGNGSTSEPTPAEEPTDDSTPARRVDATVEAVSVAPEVVTLDTPDSIGTYGTRGQQFLLVEITADNKLAPQELQLVAGEEEHTPREQIGEGLSLRRYGDQYFATEGDAGWVVFELPKPLEVFAATLTWPGGEYEIASHVLEPLGRPPTSFDVTVEAPETVEADSPATLLVTVENVGDAPGTFVGALNRTGPSIAYTPVAAAEVSLAPGETGTWEHSYDPDPGDAGSTFSFKFNWRNGREQRRIELVEPGDQKSCSDSE